MHDRQGKPIYVTHWHGNASAVTKTLHIKFERPLESIE